MKIFHVIVGLGVGGAELMLERLLLNEDQSVRRHRVVSLRGLGDFSAQMQASRLRAAGITVDTLDLDSPWHIPRALAHLIQLIREERPDVVQTWMYHSDLIGGLAARLAGCSNIVWNLRTNALPSSAFPRRTQLLQRFCALMAHLIPRKIIAASRAGLESHVAIGYPRHRIVAIGNGFIMPNSEDLSASRLRVRRDWGLSPEDCAIGMVGRFDRQKGQENFIRAAGLVARQYPQARFFIIGRQCDSANSQLMQWVEEAGLSKSIHLLGERRNVSDYLSALDVFCMPSLIEGFPNALGEAMAAGRACIATSTGGSTELLAEYGLKVPPGNSAALAVAMGRLVELSAAEREIMGQEARQHIIATHGIDRISRQYFDLYDSLLTYCPPSTHITDGNY